MTPTSARTRSLLQWGFLILLGIAGTTAFLIGRETTQFERFHSHPNVVRPWFEEAWEDKMNPTKPFSYTAEEFFGGQKVESKGGFVGVTSPSDIAFAAPYTLRDEDAFILAAISMAVLTPELSGDGPYEGPYDLPLLHFTPDGAQPLPASEAAALRLQNSTPSLGNAPKLGLTFRKKSAGRLADCVIFNSATHQPVAPSGESDDGDLAGFCSELFTWKRNELVAVLDYEVGNVTWEKLILRKDERLIHEEIQLKLLHQEDGLSMGTNNSHSSEETRYYEFGDREGQGTGTGYFIGVYPYGDDVALEFRAKDLDGNEVPLRTDGIRRFGYLIRCAEPERIAKFEVGFPGERYRQILNLPPLPRLPPENDNVGDLFDIQVPFLMVTPTALHHTIMDTTQTRGLPPLPPGPSAFIAQENVTARDLLGVYAAFEPGNSIQYDSRLHQFTVAPKRPWWRKLWPW